MFYEYDITLKIKGAVAVNLESKKSDFYLAEHDFNTAYKNDKKVDIFNICGRKIHAKFYTNNKCDSDNNSTPGRQLSRLSQYLVHYKGFEKYTTKDGGLFKCDYNYISERQSLPIIIQKVVFPIDQPLQLNDDDLINRLNYSQEDLLVALETVLKSIKFSTGNNLKTKVDGLNNIADIINNII